MKYTIDLKYATWNLNRNQKNRTRAKKRNKDGLPIWGSRLIGGASAGGSLGKNPCMSLIIHLPIPLTCVNYSEYLSGTKSCGFYKDLLRIGLLLDLRKIFEGLDGSFGAANVTVSFRKRHVEIVRDPTAFDHLLPLIPQEQGNILVLDATNGQLLLHGSELSQRTRI